MELFPDILRERIQALCEQEDQRDPVVWIKFVMPDTEWIWYATEGSSTEKSSCEEDDFTFFGYIIGIKREWGFFFLSELQASRGFRGQRIVRDLDFQPAPLSEVLQRDGLQKP